jgi:hypothetical protein
MAIRRNQTGGITNSGIYTGEYPYNGSSYGGYYGYRYFIPEMIFEHNCANNVDLTNLNIGDYVTAGQLTVDTTPTYAEITNGTTAANGTNGTTRAQVKIKLFRARQKLRLLNEEGGCLEK